MDLLPKDHSEFSRESYWNDFFAKYKSDSFEWYGEYENMCEILDKYIRMKDKVLVIGCGNSRLSADLHDIGISNITSIDITARVIKQMKAKYAKDRPAMVFQKMDVLDMSFANESFGVVLDKGTLDALLVDHKEETSEKISQMFSEIDRVLKYGGRYICISLLQEHIVDKTLTWFLEKGWMIRIHRCKRAEVQRENSITFPVFILVLTKMKQIAGSKPMQVLELVHEEKAMPKRLESKEEVTEFIKTVQSFAFLKHQLNKRKVVGEDVSLELCSPETGITKYKLFIVDRNKTSGLKFAVFIVPQGRETEWIFSSPDGRQNLASEADCERLIVVHLIRDVAYSSLDEIKKDFSNISELALGLCKSQVPILSVGEDVGTRLIRYKATSELSGDYIVEDVQSDDSEMYRRLIFLNNPYLVQSEAKLMKMQGSKKAIKFQVDFSYLSCDHHLALVFGLMFLETKLFEKGPKILQVGLGGGSLAMFLYKHYPNAKIDTVELDPSIVDVSKHWFDFIPDDRLTVSITDGVRFIKQAASEEHHYDVVMLDVDSKDPSLGMSSPPAEFLSESMLSNLSQLTATSGVVMINLACRNAKLHKETSSGIKSTFGSMFCRKNPHETNEILYCLHCKDAEQIASDVRQRSIPFEDHLKKNFECTNELDVDEFVDCIVGQV